MDCIFCKIVDGAIPAKKVYEDEKILAFYDISPAAPVHILVIPKEHIESVVDLRKENVEIVSYIFEKIRTIAKDFNLDESGFRVVTNCGDDAGQTVKHLHFHILGGRTMQWPPG
ncbi:HIT family hydrolase [Fervidicella metallireducens AeB]|uniref:HIT family hydrolase n=1 Tax=Fervidicella metallireducens AeB TaxID=1403537 RepID=A0A017RTY1_9CLOT|nr:histidine triad nucleotide-binding protein [Fervidicella metallireducens]EYE88117.1 HIT family hydrolase [Fervidicella metallireducens AeB]